MIVDWDRDAATAPAMRPGAGRRVLTTDRSTVVRVRTEPDAPFDGIAHRHPHEQWIVVVDGVLHVRCADEHAELHAGDTVLARPWQWHAATGVGPDGATYLEISTPPRWDLLPGTAVESPLEFETTATRAAGTHRSHDAPADGVTPAPSHLTMEESHAR